MLERLIIRFGLVLDDLGKDLRKRSLFKLRSRVLLWLAIINLMKKKGKLEDKSVISKAAAVIPISWRMLIILCFRQCTWFCLCSDMIIDSSHVCLAHNGDKVALLGIDDLRNCLCSAGEQEGWAVDATLVPRCQGLFFSFSAQTQQTRKYVVYMLLCVCFSKLNFWLQFWGEKLCQKSCSETWSYKGIEK